MGLDEGDKVMGVNEGGILGSEKSWVGFFDPDDMDGGNDPKVTVASRSSTPTPDPCRVLSTLSLLPSTRLT